MACGKLSLSNSIKNVTTLPPLSLEKHLKMPFSGRT